MRNLLFILLMLISTRTFPQLNMQFRSNLAYGISNELANIGGYVDSTGREYALVGCQLGLSIVDVTNPAAPFQKVLIPGTNSFWREVKVWGKYAYVTTEGGTNGLQIINLGKLPGSITTADYKYWKGTGAINNLITRLHTLHIDNGYAYLNGANGGNLLGGACLIVSLADPWNPVYLGNTQLSFTGTNRYVHDCFIRNDTLWGAHIYGGFFSVINVSNKSNPSLIGTGTVTTPGAFTHNAWLNDAGVRTLFTTDEVSNSFMTSYDVSNLANITELDRVQMNPGSGAIVHNTHIKNNYAIVSWYKEGVAIVDVSRPDNMIITGYYDTYAQGSGNGFNGCWGVYPFLPSGNIVASDINNGLYVLTPTYVRGCYLEGMVTSSCSNTIVPGVTVTINTVNVSKQGKINGVYKTGTALPGTYSVTFSKAGYVSKTISGVALNNGVLTTLNVQLDPVNAPSLSNSVISNVLCNGNTTGAVDISLSGGTAPFQYQWSNGSSAQDLSSVGAGVYSVSVTDAAGCTINASFNILQPPPLQVSFTHILPSCMGNNDGSITASVSGGTPGYSYSWNQQLKFAVLKSSNLLQSVDTSVIQNIGAGNYVFTVTDSNGCVVSSNYQLPDAVLPCSLSIQLRFFTEGFYKSYMQMNPVVSALISDTATVELVGNTAGYPVIFSNIGTVDTAGIIYLQLPVILWMEDVYVVVRHRNSLETWSKMPVRLDHITNYYDFSFMPVNARKID